MPKRIVVIPKAEILETNLRPLSGAAQNLLRYLFIALVNVSTCSNAGFLTKKFNWGIST
jgi:hypothetical protein